MLRFEVTDRLGKYPVCASFALSRFRNGHHEKASGNDFASGGADIQGPLTSDGHGGQHRRRNQPDGRLHHAFHFKKRVSEVFRECIKRKIVVVLNAELVLHAI